MLTAGEDAPLPRATPVRSAPFDSALTALNGLYSPCRMTHARVQTVRLLFSNASPSWLRMPPSIQFSKPARQHSVTAQLLR